MAIISITLDVSLDAWSGLWRVGDDAVGERLTPPYPSARPPVTTKRASDGPDVCNAPTAR